MLGLHKIRAPQKTEVFRGPHKLKRLIISKN